MDDDVDHNASSKTSATVSSLSGRTLCSSRPRPRPPVVWALRTRPGFGGPAARHAPCRLTGRMTTGMRRGRVASPETVEGTHYEVKQPDRTELVQRFVAVTALR